MFNEMLYQFEAINLEPFVRGKEPVNVTFQDGTQKMLHAWDYKSMFKHPFLYDEYYGQYLKLDAPRIIWSYFQDVLKKQEENNPLRILDIAAGSGQLGSEIRKSNAECHILVGLDILTEAKQATLRDRPGIYDDYCVLDLANLANNDLRYLKSLDPNCIFIISATGGGDTTDEHNYKDVELEEYKTLLSIVSSGSFFIFNVREHYTPGQKIILDFLKKYCKVVGHKVHFHRYLTNGEPINFQTFILKKI